MHEMGIVEQIKANALAALPDDLKHASVKKIQLKVGALAAVKPDSLRFCFELASKGTPFEQTTLEIEEIPAVARCRKCQHQWTVLEPVLTCEICESSSVEVISGWELHIESMEVVDSDKESD